MRPDPDELRRYYASLSDDALLEIERNDLTEVAQACYDAELAERGLNFSRTASALNTTQPAISRMIRSLEQELGTELLVRRGKTMLRLSPQGEEAVARARLAGRSAGYAPGNGHALGGLGSVAMERGNLAEAERLRALDWRGPILLLEGVARRDFSAQVKERMLMVGFALLMLLILELLRRGRLRRVHRKLAVVDGRVAFVGGINIIDDPHRVRGLRSKPFDGEGVANAKRKVIDAGTLTTITSFSTGIMLPIAGFSCAGSSAQAISASMQPALAPSALRGAWQAAQWPRPCTR